MTTPATRPLLSASSVAGAGIGVAALLAAYSLASWVLHGLSVDATPWVQELPALRVPMAASTAVLLLVLVSVLGARLHWPNSPRVRFLTAAGAAFVSIIAILELARARWNMTLPWDPPLTMVQTTIGVSVIGRMAVTAALCCLLAAVALVSGCRWLFAGRAAAWVSDVASLTGAFIASQSLLGLAAGTPLAMEQSAIPMSVAAAIAFLALFAAVVIARRVDEATEARAAGPHNFDWRMASWLSGLAMACVVVAFWYAHSRQGQVRKAVLEELKILADMRAREAVAWRNERIGDTHTLAAIAGLPEAIARLSTGGSPSDKLIAHITGHRHSYGYDRIVLYDAALKPVLVFPADSIPVHGLSVDTRRAVLTTTDVIVEDLHRGGDGVVHMDFIAAVRNGDQFAGVVQETIIARSDLSLLDPWPVTSRSVETELLRRDGDSIDLLSELRDQDGSAMTQRVATSDATRLGAIILRGGQKGLVSGLDYREVPVLGVASAVPGTPWVVIAKMDQAEAFAPVRKEASLLLFGMVMLTALVALLVLNRVNSVARLQLERMVRAEDVALTAKTALRGSEARFHALAESSIVGIYVFQEGKYTYVNPAMAALFGYTVAEVLNVAPSDMVQPHELERVNYNIENRLHGDARTMHYQLRGRRKDGSTIEVEVYGSRVEINGKPALFGTLVDISERRKAEAALRESVGQQRLQAAALEATVNAVMITDRHGRIEWVNPAFTTISGYSLADVIGKTPRVLKSGLQSALFYQDLWQTIASGRSWSGGMVNTRKDGTHYSEEVTITPVHDENGGIAHFVAVINDVTEKKSLEKQVVESQRLESIGLLASGIAHDLNNILSPIAMAVGMLRDKIPEERDMFDAMERSVDRGADIVRQVLTFARGVDGKRTPLRVGLLIKEISRLITETMPREIKLTRNLAVKSDTVLADPTQVHQIVLNLVVNARDAMPEGGKLDISLINESLDDKTASASGARPGEYLVIKVADTGIGMAPATVGRIFEPFFTTKPVGQGTGLGLSTVHGIVRSHGGFIQVQSALGAGTTFKVYLPLAACGALTPEVTTTAKLPTGNGECILIADDEAGIRAITRDVLQRKGFTCLFAENGARAVEQFQAHRAEVKLVLLDRMMPVQDGESAARAIHSMAPEMPIILASGLFAAQGSASATPDLVDAGIVATLPKPFTGPQLVTLISQHIAH